MFFAKCAWIEGGVTSSAGKLGQVYVDAKKLSV